jgi:hypothetical protein
VSKSLIAIAGIGIAGCVLLSVMMQQLVERKKVHDEVRPLAAFEVQHRDDLVAPLAVHEESHGVTARLAVLARVRATVDRPAFAAAIAAAAWQQLRDDPLIGEVHVTVRDADGQPAYSLVAPRPASSPPR